MQGRIQKQHLLIEGRFVVLGRALEVLVGLGPRVPLWRELVRGERTRAGCEGARDGDGLLSIPCVVLAQHACVCDTISRSQLVHL